MTLWSLTNHLVRFNIPDRKEHCSSCNGWGKSSPSSKEKCTRCGGTGEFYFDDLDCLYVIIADVNNLELCINHDSSHSDDVWSQNPLRFNAREVFKICLEYKIIKNISEFFKLLEQADIETLDEDKELFSITSDDPECIPDNVEYEIYELECHDPDFGVHKRNEDWEYAD